MQKPVNLAHDSSVELAWWIEPPAVQFRIRGQAYTLPPDKTQANEVIKRLQLSGDEAKGAWWEDKRENIWSDLTGHIRASFARPTPGTPLDQAKEKPEDWIERLDAESVGFFPSREQRWAADIDMFIFAFRRTIRNNRQKSRMHSLISPSLPSYPIL